MYNCAALIAAGSHIAKLIDVLPAGMGLSPALLQSLQSSVPFGRIVLMLLIISHEFDNESRTRICAQIGPIYWIDS